MKFDQPVQAFHVQCAVLRHRRHQRDDATFNHATHLGSQKAHVTVRRRTLTTARFFSKAKPYPFGQGQSRGEGGTLFFISFKY
jgi:hypothetical protein